MIDWSVTNLPLPSALSVTNRSAALRKKAESGRYLQRRRFTTAYEEGTVSFKFLKEQFQIFKGVWVHYLNNGTTAFTIDLPVGGNTTLTNCEVKFVSDYSYQYVSVDYVTVQCKIEFKEVTAPDKLALDNLINVSDIYLQREAETVVVTFTNIDGTSNNYVRCTLYGEVTNSIPQATQFWDGTVHLHTGTPSTLKYLETTISEEEFVLHHYPTFNTTDPTPNPNGKFGKFTVANGQTNLKRWDPNSTPSYYWKSIILTNAINYIPPEPEDTFKYHINDSFETLQMVNADKIRKINLTCEDNATFDYVSRGTYDLDIRSCDLLEEITVSLPPNNVGALYSDLRINGMNGLTVCDLRGMKPQDTTYAAYTFINNNPSLQTITLNGTPDWTEEVILLNDNNLDTLNIFSGYRWALGNTGNFVLRNNNFTVSSLLQVVDKIKGDPFTPYVHLSAVQISGNPCWQNNDIYPKPFGNPMNITGITSTATEITVTTSSNHNLNPNDRIDISSTSAQEYNRAWRVAATPTSTTFTLTSNLNAGNATGGTVSFELSSNSAELVVRAAENNFVFGS